MAEQIPIEQRVAALEKEITELKQQLQTGRASDNWIERISGSMVDFPEFEEVVRYGRMIRQTETNMNALAEGTKPHAMLDGQTVEFSTQDVAIQESGGT